MVITATTPTDFRKNMASFLTSVVTDKTELILTRGKEGNAVVISEDTWNTLNATLQHMTTEEAKTHLVPSIHHAKATSERANQEFSKED